MDIVRAAVAVVTEHRARWASGCLPPSVASGRGNNCTLLPASWTILAHLETFPAQAAFTMFKGFLHGVTNSCLAERMVNSNSVWLAVLNRSVPLLLPSARISGLSLCFLSGLSLK